MTYNAALVLTNTVVANQAYGIRTTNVSADVQADHTLWYNNSGDVDVSAGGIVSTTNDVYGDPSFVGSGGPFAAYHLQVSSAAIDAGIDADLDLDVDGEARPYDVGFDIGADEYPGLANAPAAVSITAPITGMIQTEYAFAATVSPITTTPPITYVWQPSALEPLTHVSDQGDVAAFIWHTPGPQNVLLSATNEAGTVTNTHQITLSAPPAAEFPFFDGFEMGALDPVWLTQVIGQGRIQANTYAPQAGLYSALLDDAVQDSTYSTAALILTIDLAGQPNAVLDFWWREFGDENHPQDGVFLSDDYGANWYQVLSFNDGPQSYQHEYVDLGTAATAHGLTFNDQFQIKFQFYDNEPVPNDGYAIDNVRVAPATPVESVSITGPTDGVANATYTFTATISPITATPPILYAWHAADQVPITHTTGISDEVAFTWTLSGTKAITLTAANAASAVTGTHAIAVDAPAIIALAPAAVEQTLAAGAVHTTSLTISNTGGSLLSWSGVTSEPDWSAIDPSSGVVLPGQASPVSLTLDASALVSGTYNANLEFQSNDPVTSLITVPVTLQVAGQPSAVITPTLLDFGDVFVGYTYTLHIDVENVGAAGLIVSDIAVSDPDLSVSPTSLSLPPLAVQAVDVVCIPSALGGLTATLTFTTNDPVTPVRTVDVVATAVHTPAISTDPAAFDLSQEAGVVSTRTLLILNGGQGLLEYALSLDTGVVAVEPVSGTLAGAGQSPVTVIFDTTALPGGTYHDQIWVASNDPVTPLMTIPVTLTVTLTPPEAPANPDPQDGESNVPVNTVLSWQDSLHATSYDLYFWEEGQTKPITPTAGALTQPSYDPPGDLSTGTTYHWQVVARNTAGDTPGPEWTFVTQYLSDLTVAGIGVTPVVYAAGEVVTFTAVVSNADLGGAVGSFHVRFEVDGAFIGRQIVAGLDSGQALDLVQTWAATPRAGAVTVIVDEFDAVEEQDENNNQLTQALPATLAPDLVVTDVTWSPEGIDDGEGITIAATVVNSSTIDAAQSFQVRFEIDGAYLGSQQVSDLAWGETAVVSQTWNATVGSHTVLIIADEWNSVDEADEDNNARTEPLPEVVAADLLVDSIDWSPQANIDDGDLVIFTAVISNAGPGATFRSSYVRFEVDGVLIGRAQIAGIEAGQSAEATLTWVAVAGSDTIRAVADEYDTIAETSEVNNDLSDSLPQIRMPDLTANNLSWAPTANIQDGDQVTITVTVENIGTGDTSRSFGVLFEVGGASIGSAQVSTLDSGSSVAVTRTWSAVPGDHLVRVVVDQDDVVRESEEGNNEVSQEPLQVLVPDLTVADVVWSPVQISDGTEVSFAATISNTGSGDISSSFQVGFELDGGNIGWEQVAGGLAVNASTTITLSQPWIAPNGQHTVTVTADLFGAITEISETNNRLTETLSVVDGNAPVLVGISPADGAVSNDVYTVTATLGDALGQGVDIGQCALDLWLDGAPISGTQTFPGSDQIALVPDQPLEEGDYQVDILAVDLQGNSASYQTFFALDMTPPLIEVTGVSDGASYETCITPTVAPRGSWVRTFDAYGRPVCSTMGRASMSDRSKRTLPGPFSRMPTTP